MLTFFWGFWFGWVICRLVCVWDECVKSTKSKDTDDNTNDNTNSANNTNNLKKDIKCELIGKKCIHANIHPDEGLYDNCRFCEVYEREYVNYLWEKSR